MGSNLGPSIANIVVYKLENKWFKIHRPIIYKRFIDDIFIASATKININEFKDNFGYLKLNVIHEKVIQFLDLEIYFDQIINKLNFSLYIKPTNTFSYLDVKSNHPQHIFKNIPKSLFIRVRRICTNFSSYLYFCRKIYVHLLQCGYDAMVMNKLIQMIGNIDRDKLIDYKKKCNNSTYDNKTFNFRLRFSNKFYLKSLLLNCFKEVIKDNNFPSINLKQFYTVDNNIRDILIHEKKFCNYSFHKTSTCNLQFCKTCSFINRTNKLIFKNGLILPLLSSSNCNAKNCIYILYCDLCDSHYIGQSNSFKKRFANHISTIKNYKFNKSDCETAKHFN